MPRERNVSPVNRLRDRESTPRSVLFPGCSAFARYILSWDTRVKSTNACAVVLGARHSSPRAVLDRTNVAIYANLNYASRE